jgi:hypothetical protein
MMKFSKNKHIPLFTLGKREFYPWQLRSFFDCKHTTSWLLKEYGLRFWEHTTIIDAEWASWNLCYHPPAGVDRNALILDAGAGEGETAFFYCYNGFRNIRVVESDKKKIPLLNKNVKALEKRFQVNIEVKGEPFASVHLKDVQFMKMDIEGAESAFLDLRSVSFPFVIETHGQEMRKKLLDWYGDRAELKQTWNSENNVEIWQVNY